MHRYFKRISSEGASTSSGIYAPPAPGLPDPNKAATSAAAQQCAAANAAIVEARQKKKVKRGSYTDYTKEERLKMAEYAIHNGPAKAARHFSALMNKSVNESTIRWIRDAYRKEQQRRWSSGNDEEVTSFERNKRGRPTTLPKAVDMAVQQHLRNVRLSGGVVNGTVAMAAGRGIAAKMRAALPDSCFNKEWARSLLQRMNFVKRKGTKAAKKVPSNISEIRANFHQMIVDVVTKENIPGESL